VQEGAAAVREALNAEAPGANLANLSGGGDESDAESDILSLGHNSSHNSSSNDLALLRSANADEVPEDVFVHTDVVNQLQETEEAIIGNHCDLIEHDIPSFDAELKELAKVTNEVDYDTEAYATKLSELLGSKIELFAGLKARVDEYLAELRKEELISRTLSAKRGVQPAAAPPPASTPSIPPAHGHPSASAAVRHK
jgi:Asp-tRNA(Asn)/Glu-tRNA(Gln) amidotransferase A subunit family amidase